MITVYGLKNCDTCRKALKWLVGHDIKHQFHDVRDDELEAGRIAGWIDAVGLEVLVNRRSTTWRNLDEATREAALGPAAAAVLADHPTLIKRPVIALGDEILVGFNEAIEKLLLGRGEPALK